MQQYLARRLLQMAPTLFLVSLVTFFVLRVLPGDVAILVVTGGTGSEGGSQAVRSQELEEVRESLGLDASLGLQYLRLMKGFITLDWGESLFSQRPVWGDVTRKLPVTLELALLSSIIAVMIGVPLGMISALRQGTWLDNLLRLLALGGLSIPNFWLATLLLMGGLQLFGWIPRVEYVGLLDRPLANLGQLIWPALILAYSAAAIISRMTRSSLLEALRQEYIRTARAKGLRERVVLLRHAAKNAMLPVITVIGLLFVSLASGSVIMEQIFGLPGLGLFLLDGVRFRDYAVVQPLVLLFATGVLIVNLVVDVAYVWLDPRIRFR